MGILGIKNRTEDWKTVQHFHGLSDSAKVGLARCLGEPKDTVAEEISIELFWHGMRDYDKEHQVSDEVVAVAYGQLFPKLRQKVLEFKGRNEFAKLEAHNYSRDDEDRLASNVKRTEVDIVLETPDRIFIGEAKYMSDLGTDGSLVLVHQLIRQYVTVKILAYLAGSPKNVISFVVANEKGLERRQEKAQVEFMTQQGWLPEGNVLSWGDINDIRIGRR